MNTGEVMSFKDHLICLMLLIAAVVSFAIALNQNYDSSKQKHIIRDIIKQELEETRRER